MLDLLALDLPEQQFVTQALWYELPDELLRDEFPRTWFLGVGISFSFVTGEVQRAPDWAQRFGLEWAHRLLKEPRRLARRYLWHDLPFAAAVELGSLSAAQFHPEKSGDSGYALLRNWVDRL